MGICHVVMPTFTVILSPQAKNLVLLTSRSTHLQGRPEPFLCEILTIRIAIAHKSDFLRACPALDTLLSLNRLPDITEWFEVDTAREVVARGKGSLQRVPVFKHTPDEVVCHANVQSAGAVTHDVHVVLPLLVTHVRSL